MPCPDPLDRFLAQVATRTTAPAVALRERTVRYEELGRLVRRMAAAMAARAPHPKVLIHLPQGVGAYAAMLGTLMAGGYYAPVNLDAPAQRQLLVREQFRPDVVVVRRADLGTFAPQPDGPLLLVVEDLGDAELDTPEPAHRLAYVIFTSGSTGVPKGVMIPRSALAHYLDWAIPYLAIGPGDRCSQHPNIGFDLSVLDIYATLCSGACLVPLIGARDRLMPADAIRDQGMTIWISVPSVVDLMRKAGQLTAAHLGSLRAMLFCGEPLLTEHVEAIFAARPDIDLINTYGPTEATVSCTALRLTPGNYVGACADSVAIGDAIPNMRLHLVDSEVTAAGEVALSGPQLAEGYWQDAEKTARAFRTLPGTGVRAYFTGDWAERRDGHFFFKARIDRQVKIHGHRLELGEIDAALRQAGVLVSFTVFTGGRLVSFVEAGPGFEAAKLREGLAERLPPYAVPDSIRVLDLLPRNANDKIDAQQLIAMVPA